VTESLDDFVTVHLTQAAMLSPLMECSFRRGGLLDSSTALHHHHLNSGTWQWELPPFT